MPPLISTPSAGSVSPVLTSDHPIAQCVDLRASFRGLFRFAWDDAHGAERPDYRRVEAAWLTVIRCRFGKIFPWGGRLLAAYSTSRRRALVALPGVTVVLGGAVGQAHAPEVIVRFDVWYSSRSRRAWGHTGLDGCRRTSGRGGRTPPGGSKIQSSASDFASRKAERL